MHSLSSGTGWKNDLALGRGRRIAITPGRIAMALGLVFLLVLLMEASFFTWAWRRGGALDRRGRTLEGCFGQLGFCNWMDTGSFDLIVLMVID